jgi:diguanylate cyclase (GGDEF)-like protein
MLADLDHFKQINDTHGHLVGDQVLRQTARSIREELRTYDGIGRYGGEEFLLVLPGCDESAMLGLAERVRQAVAREPGETLHPPIPVTISLGAVCCNGPGGDPLAVLRRADEALYRAKHAGRNRVVLASSDPSAAPTSC